MEPAVVEALGRPHVGIDGSVTHVSLGCGEYCDRDRLARRAEPYGPEPGTGGFGRFR